MAKETFKQARTRLLHYFETARTLDWETHHVDVRTARPLKVPYVQRKSDGARIWFKPQAAYYTHGSMRTLSAGRSLVEDIREKRPQQLIELMDRLLKDE